MESEIKVHGLKQIQGIEEVTANIDVLRSTAFERIVKLEIVGSKDVLAKVAFQLLFGKTSAELNGSLVALNGTCVSYLEEDEKIIAEAKIMEPQ